MFSYTDTLRCSHIQKHKLGINMRLQGFSHPEANSRDKDSVHRTTPDETHAHTQNSAVWVVHSVIRGSKKPDSCSRFPNSQRGDEGQRTMTLFLFCRL